MNDFKVGGKFGKAEFEAAFKNMFDSSSVIWPSPIFCLRCNSPLPKNQVRGVYVCAACLNSPAKEEL